MRQADLELIQRLCATAGMIMEDASVEAIRKLSADPHERRACLVRLRFAARDIGALIAAGEVLDRRSDGRGDDTP